MHTVPEKNRYQAFISYSHTDEAHARWLHKALETYRMPKDLVRQLDRDTRKLGAVFRDREEMASSTDLSAEIGKALAESAALIVICSPAARQSRWVNEEIRRFAAVGDRSRIYCLIVAGEPGSVDFDCMPEALLGLSDTEHLAADLRPGKDGKALAKLKIIAGLLGVRLDELRRRESQRRQKQFGGVALFTTALLAFMTFLASQAIIARQDAEQRRLRADALISFMLGDLRDRLDTIGRLDVLDATGVQALEYFESMDPDELDYDDLARQAVALRMIGQIRIDEGRPLDALASYERAARLTEERSTRAPNDWRIWFDRYTDASSLGEAYWELQQQENTLELMLEGLQHLTKAVALAPPEEELRLQLAIVENNLGAVNTRLNDIQAALIHFAQAADVTDELLVESPDETLYLAQKAETASWLGDLNSQIGAYDEAIAWHEEELRIRKRLVQLDKDPFHEIKLASAYGFYAATLARLGRLDEALGKQKTKAKALASLSLRDPANGGLQANAAQAHIRWADYQCSAGDYEAALASLAAHGSTVKDLLEKDPGNSTWQVDEAYTSTVRVRALADPVLALAAAKTSYDDVSAFVLAQNDGASARLLEVFGYAAIQLSELLVRSGNQVAADYILQSALARLDADGAEAVIYKKAQQVAMLYLLGRGDEATELAQELVAKRYRDPKYWSFVEAVLE